MPVPDGSFASVVGHLEVLGQLQGVGRAGVLAETAKHAPREVVGEGGQNFAAALLVALPAHDDQVFRATQRAEVAGDAEGLAGFRVVIQSCAPR